MNLARRLFPFINWFPMSSENLKADFIAGLTVALVLIPQSMAYAQLAGMPPYYGLYAAFLPVILGALWGSSSFLSTGPAAMTGLLTAATLMPYAEIGSEKFIGLAITLAFLVGICRLAIGIFKLTFLVNFLSQPVIRGFINAGAVIIATSQLNKLLGVSMAKTDFYLRDICKVIMRAGETHLPTLIIGLSAMLLIILLKKFIPKLPSSLVVAILGSLAVWGFNLAGTPGDTGEHVAVIGEIPSGLPGFSIPNLNLKLIIELLPGALVVMFIGFMEVCSVSKALSAKSKQKVDLNQELIGQGTAAVVGSFFQCFPTSGGSFSRSALNYSSGAKTGMCSVFTGSIVLLTLLFLTKLLYFLPHAVLAAIIIVAVIGLVDFKAMVHAWKIDFSDGLSGLITFLATLYFAPNMVIGILVGAGLALSLHLYKTMKPRVAVLGLHDDGSMRDADLHSLPIDEKSPLIRFDGRLYFASVSYFEDAVLGVLNRFPEANYIIISADGINAIDASGEAMLHDLIPRLRASGVEMLFVGLKHQVETVINRSGLEDLIGRDKFFRTIQDVENFIESQNKIKGTDESV
jgi:SulP family sulfate permease